MILYNSEKHLIYIIILFPSMSMMVSRMSSFFIGYARITGYLVGTMDQWNNAKKGEERDRVKHTVGAEKTI